jgi:hypothetical protein
MGSQGTCAMASSEQSPLSANYRFADDQATMTLDLQPCNASSVDKIKSLLGEAWQMSLPKDPDTEFDNDEEDHDKHKVLKTMDNTVVTKHTSYASKLCKSADEVESGKTAQDTPKSLLVQAWQKSLPKEFDNEEETTTSTRY